MPDVVIEGDGVAAACVARLLTDAGVACVLESNPRPKLAAILLGAQTQHLLRDVFAPTQDATQDLFDGFAQVNRRMVLWGDPGAPVDLPHAAVVAPEDELLRRLWQRVPSIPRFNGRATASWRIQSSRENTTGQERCFGSREAQIAQVELRTDAEDEACWAESVAGGWLFLLSRGEGRATLIAAGGAVGHLLAESRLVGPRVAGVFSEGAALTVYPRLRQPLMDGKTILCGTAAMSFDPLCGEGAGNAVREAFLAAAVIRAGLSGIDCERLKEHYVSRLSKGFLRHLQICLQFYETGGSGGAWKRDTEALRAGVTELQLELAKAPPAPFRLVDRDLVEL